MHMGAGTVHTATTLRALGPEPWNAAFVQPDRRFAKLTHRGHAVAYEQHGTSMTGNIAHLAKTLLLKSRIANRQHLVKHEHLGFAELGKADRLMP